MSSASTVSHGTNQTRKATASGWIGSVLECYDFFTYATAASLIFPQIFFPVTDPKMAIVASLATMAWVIWRAPLAPSSWVIGATPMVASRC